MQVYLHFHCQTKSSGFSHHIMYFGHFPCTKHVICPVGVSCSFQEILWDQVGQGEPRKSVLVKNQTGSGITPSHWPAPSHTPRPNASNAAGLSDILPTAGSKTPTCQPRSVTARKTFYLTREDMSIVFNIHLTSFHISTHFSTVWDGLTASGK